MKFRFKKQSNGSIYAYDGQSTKRLATYTHTEETDWTCALNDKHELAEGVEAAMDSAFEEYLHKQESPEETPTPAPDVAPIDRKAPPAPEPDPISGTTSIPYMLWAAHHADDTTFLELYGDRIANKPSFLPWIRRTETLEPFRIRAEKLLTA